MDVFKVIFLVDGNELAVELSYQNIVEQNNKNRIKPFGLFN